METHIWMYLIHGFSSETSLYNLILHVARGRASARPRVLEEEPRAACLSSTHQVSTTLSTSLSAISATVKSWRGEKQMT